MKKVFINAFNNHSGGGKSYLINFSRLLNQHKSIDSYYILVPPNIKMEFEKNDNISIITLPSILSKMIFLPLCYIFLIPMIVYFKKCSRVLNFSDIPIITKSKQIMLFDWPYGLYPDSKAWQMMNKKDLFRRKVKLFILKKLIRFVDEFIVQNSVMKKRLEKYWKFRNAHIIPNAISLDSLDSNFKTLQLRSTRKNRLLCLTHYYTHKNLEIFIPLAKEIKKQNLNFEIIITISKDQSSEAKLLLKSVDKEGLQNIIYNIGPVSMEYIPSLYNQSDALLLPTTLETFSGTYIEAIFHKKPIFTSDLDFARNVCKDYAYYFNPYDHFSILECVKEAFHKKEKFQDKLKLGDKLLKLYPDWNMAFSSFMKTLDS